METTTPPPAGREDWWSEDATATLIQAWGHRYLKLNFGNLRQNDWKDVADSVNSSHRNGRPKTDGQCKNRIDTLKKKYKTEKAKLSPSAWRFFDRLDVLIGPVSKKPASGVVKSASMNPNLNLKSTGSSLGDGGWGRKHPRVRVEEVDDQRPCMELARAILKLGEAYERSEGRKQKMMIELEKQRMQVAKEIELQRMNMLVEMQLELEKSKHQKKRGARSGKKL